MVRGQPVEVDLVNDGWTEIMRSLTAMSPARKAAVSKREAAPLTRSPTSRR
jgi:hypothetical protein